MSLSKTYALHAQIKTHELELAENAKTFKTIKYTQSFLTVATTLIYLSFTAVIFAGVSIWAFQDYVFGNATNVTGLIFTVSLVIATPIGLALAKHSNFQAMARERDLKTFFIRGLIALAICSGIWYEAISSSSNLQEKAFHSVENSKSGSSILNSSVTISSGENSELAKAEFKLVSCKRKLSEDKVRDCANSQASVDSLKEQAALTRASVAKANVDAITAKQSALDKERDSRVLPAAKAIATWFDTTLPAGTFIIVVISSIFFELIHLTTVYSERTNLLERNSLNQRLQDLKTEYFKQAGKVYSPSDFKDGHIIDLEELRETGAMNDFRNSQPEELDDNPAYEIRTKGRPYEAPKPGFGFVPASANQRFKWQADHEPDTRQQPERGFGFIRTSLPSKSDTCEAQSNVLKTQDTRLNVSSVSPLASSVSPLASIVLTAKDVAEGYTVGQCKHCGCDFKRKTKRALYCKDKCRFDYHNLHNPTVANERAKKHSAK